MSNPLHRFVGTVLSRSDGEHFTAGDTLHPTDAELRAFGDLLEPVPDAESDAQSDTTPIETQDTDGTEDAESGGESGEDGALPFDPTTMTVTEVRTAMSERGNSLDDETLVALVAREKEGGGRSTAIDAIEAKMSE